jgi:hypothetical protein
MGRRLGGHKSPSEAVLALCLMLAFWAPDPDRLDALFRQPGALPFHPDLAPTRHAEKAALRAAT